MRETTPTVMTVDFRHARLRNRGMDVVQKANEIWAILKDDPAAMNQIRSEARSLAIAFALDPDASSQVTSATVNGQSFSMAPSMTQGQRLSLLRYILRAADSGGPISKTAITTFNS